ncbi:MAG: VOC family protein [Gemmatimonadaceae bacterium]|nr:VOC family protein [Gemmatimonadaceae bacterium]
MNAIGLIAPCLFYRDANAAIEFLVRAFDFRVRLQVPDEQGGVAHAELTFRDSVIMVGTAKPARGWQSPMDLAGVNQTLSVTVEDADAHHAQAVAAGAYIERGLEDASYGSRGYEARDPEGNCWYFGTYVPGAWWDGKTPG